MQILSRDRLCERITVFDGHVWLTRVDQSELWDRQMMGVAGLLEAKPFRVRNRHGFQEAFDRVVVVTYAIKSCSNILLREM